MFPPVHCKEGSPCQLALLLSEPVCRLEIPLFQHLISQANDGKWSKEEVVSIVFRKNRDNQLILATLNEETRKQAAVLNKAKTISAVPYMDVDFLQWLYQEAVEGRWEKSMVFQAIIKEELDGKASLSPKIKPGITIVKF